MTAQPEEVIRYAEDVLGYRLYYWQKLALFGIGETYLGGRGHGRQMIARICYETRNLCRPGKGRPLIHKGRKP